MVDTKFRHRSGQQPGKREGASASTSTSCSKSVIALKGEEVRKCSDYCWKDFLKGQERGEGGGALLGTRQRWGWG